MPIDFNATFVTPLLAQLDAGTIGSGEDFATAIVDAYIATVKTGLPQNVVTTLPAPGLTVPPAPPPPFPIGASAFLTADQRKKKMSTIINAYFKAKDGSVDKATIDSLKITIDRTVSSVKASKSQIDSIAAEIETIATEVAKFPETIEDIGKGLKEEFERVKTKINDIYDTLLLDVAVLGINEFNRKFADQIAFIGKLKDFKPDLESASSVIRFIASQKKVIDSKFGTAASAEKTTTNYITSKLMSLASHLIKIAKSILDPIALLNYIEQLVPLVPSLKKVYEKIKKFKIIKDTLERKLYKLNKKKKAIQLQISNYHEPKIKALSVKLAKKIANLGKKKRSQKSAELYAKTSKDVSDRKKAFDKRIKKRKVQLEKLIKAGKLSAKLVSNSMLLANDLRLEFDSIKKKIEDLQRLQKETKAKLDAIDTQNPLADFKNIQYKPIIPDNFKIEKVPSTDQAVAMASSARSAIVSGDGLQLLKLELNKLKKQFDGTGLGQFTGVASAAMRATKTDFETFKHFFNVKENIEKSASVANLEAELLVLNKDAITLKSVFEEDKAGLAELPGADGSIRVLTTNYEKSLALINASIKTIKESLKKIKESPPSSAYSKYVNRIHQLQVDLKSIKAVIKTIKVVEVKDPPVVVEPTKPKEPKTEHPWLTKRISSLSKVLNYLVADLEPDIARLIVLIKKEINVIKKFIKKEIDIFLKSIKKLLISRIPPNSKVDDIKEKKKKHEDKIAMTKYRIARAKRLVAEVQLILKMAGGATKLTTNIVTKKVYKYESNQPYINLFIDSYYDLLFLRETDVLISSGGITPSPAVIEARQAQLAQDKKYYEEEKKRIKQKFEPLIVIDILVFGLIESIKEAKFSNFIKDLKGYVDMVEATADHPGKNTIKSLQAMMTILESPPTTVSEITSAAKKITKDVIASIGQDTNIVTPLAQIETKYLANSRQSIRKLCKIAFINDISKLQQPAIDKLNSMRIVHEIDMSNQATKAAKLKNIEINYTTERAELQQTLAGKPQEQGSLAVFDLEHKKTVKSFLDSEGSVASEAELAMLQKEYEDEVEKIKEVNNSTISSIKGGKTAQLLLKIDKSLTENKSFIMLGFDMLVVLIKEFVAFLSKIIKDFIKVQKEKLEKKKAEVELEGKRRVKKEVEARVNTEAIILTGLFGLAARLFWTGASWYGQTGTKHTVLNIGRFTKMDFLASSGRSGMVKEIARGFEHQLAGMVGIISPPPNTAIPPFPFKGYLLVQPVAILLAGEASANAAAGLA